MLPLVSSITTAVMDENKQAMIEADEPIDAAWISAGTWTVEIVDREWPCTVSLRPLFDPANEKIKLSVRGLNFFYGNFHALKHINLDIPENKVTAFIGPSGCGKSTLLRMLAGLEEITGGQILIDDKVVNDLESKDRDIAMVFQSYALYPHMTVRENMGFGLRMRGVPSAALTRYDRPDSVRGNAPPMYSL